MGFRESPKVTSKGGPRPDLARQQAQPSGFDDRISLVFGNKSRDTRRRLGQPSAMLDQKTGLPKSGQRLLPGTSPANSPRQQRLMLVALGLLLISLTFVLYRDRDFWFPDTDEAESRSLSPSVAQDTPPTVFPAPPTATTAPASRKKPHVREAVSKQSQNSNDP